jgi:hypothetical protein
VSRLTTPPAIGVLNNLVLPTRFLALALCNGRSNDASPSVSFAGFAADPADAEPADADDADDADASPLASPAADAETSALAPPLLSTRLARNAPIENDDNDDDDEDDVDAPIVVVPCRCRPHTRDAPPLLRELPSADLAPPLRCRRPGVNPPVVAQPPAMNVAIVVDRPVFAAVVSKGRSRRRASVCRRRPKRVDLSKPKPRETLLERQRTVLNDLQYEYSNEHDALRWTYGRMDGFR